MRNGRRRAEAGRTVLATIGNDHPGRRVKAIVAAANAVARRGPTTLLNLGAAPPFLPGLNAAIDLVEPGHLTGADLGEHLAGADLCLLPYLDGASTRRTTLIAALQQQVACVTNDGPATDAELREPGALSLVEAHASDDAFAAAALALAGDDRLRADQAAAGRRLFERSFSWPVLATRFVTGLDDAASKV